MKIRKRARCLWWRRRCRLLIKSNSTRMEAATSRRNSMLRKLSLPKPKLRTRRLQNLQKSRNLSLHPKLKRNQLPLNPQLKNPVPLSSKNCSSKLTANLLSNKVTRRSKHSSTLSRKLFWLPRKRMRSQRQANLLNRLRLKNLSNRQNRLNLRPQSLK